MIDTVTLILLTLAITWMFRKTWKAMDARDAAEDQVRHLELVIEARDKHIAWLVSTYDETDEDGVDHGC